MVGVGKCLSGISMSCQFMRCTKTPCLHCLCLQPFQPAQLRATVSDLTMRSQPSLRPSSCSSSLERQHATSCPCSQQQPAFAPALQSIKVHQETIRILKKEKKGLEATLQKAISLGTTLAGQTERHKQQVSCDALPDAP